MEIPTSKISRAAELNKDKLQRGLSFYHLVKRNQLIRLQSGDTLVYVLM